MGGAETEEGRDASLVEADPGLATGGEGLRGVDVPVGPAEGRDHLVPLHGVGHSRVQLAQIAVLSQLVRRQSRRHDGRGLLGAGQHRGVHGDRIIELVSDLEASGQGPGLLSSQVREARAATRASHDPRHVAPGLAVAHEHQAGATGLLAAGAKALGWFDGHQVSPPTKSSSWRKVRHSRTSSQCGA